MRKTWLLALFAAAVMIAVAILMLGRSPSDGLDYIRKYGPEREFLSEVSGVSNIMSAAPKAFSTWDRVFVFDQVPQELLSEINEKGSRVVSVVTGKPENMVIFETPDKRPCVFYGSKNMILVAGEPEPSWISRQWQNLRKQMGADFSTPRTKIE